MKTWRKVSALILAMSMTLGLAACGSKDNKANETSGAASTTAESGAATSGAKDSKLTENDLYLITDLGTIDDKSFNQGSFTGLSKYAKESGLKDAKYLRPQGEGDQVYKQTIDQAIAAGAKVVVTPGYLFETAVGAAQEQYPDVKFILVDAVPKTADKKEKITQNTVSVQYKEQESGFLAGYAAVKDGYTKLGFMGGLAVPAVVNYGFGFLSGANYAAKELGKKVEVKYNYTGTFNDSPDVTSKAASWYKSGTEVIFSCGGQISTSINKAANENNGKMIGVDVDQKDLGPNVITSAMKNLSNSVYEEVKAIYSDHFQGGKKVLLGAKENGVQISEDFSRFKQFKKEDYDKVYKMIAENQDGFADKIAKIDFSLKQNEQADPSLIKGLDSLSLDYIK